MKENIIEIPYYKTLSLRHVVLDYNGTIAKDGLLKEAVKTLLPTLCETYTVHVITADTFGSVKSQMKNFDANIKVLETNNHTAEKATFIDDLGKEYCVALGNGNNDAQMLKNATLGIAIIGDEGCSTATLLASDVTCSSIKDALDLVLSEKRMIATLRK